MFDRGTAKVRMVIYSGNLQRLDMCPFCHTAKVSSAVCLLRHSCKNVARGGLQNRRLSYDKMGTHRVSVNYHSKLPHELSQFFFQTRYISLNFPIIIPKYRFLKVFTSFGKTLCIYIYIHPYTYIYTCIYMYKDSAKI